MSSSEPIHHQKASAAAAPPPRRPHPPPSRSAPVPTTSNEEKLVKDNPSARRLDVHATSQQVTVNDFTPIDERAKVRTKGTPTSSHPSNLINRGFKTTISAINEQERTQVLSAAPARSDEQVKIGINSGKRRGRGDSIVLDELKSVREQKLTAAVVKVLNDEPRSNRHTWCQCDKFLSLVFLPFYPMTIGVWQVLFEPWLCCGKPMRKQVSILAWTSCIFTKEFHLWLAIARFSGKLISVFTSLALFVILKPVVEVIEVQPIARGRLNWRRYHYKFVIAAFTAAAVHGFAHWKRQESVKIRRTHFLMTLKVLETGLESFSIYCTSSPDCPYGCCRESQTRWIFKKAFRMFHIPFYVAITFLYVIHSKDGWPLIFFLVWFVVNSWSRVKVEKLEYRFMVNGLKNPQPETSDGKYILELRVTARNVMPVDFGFYCVLSRATYFSSYTMIPLSRNHFMFQIKNCVLTESLRPLLHSTEYCGDEEDCWFKVADKSGIRVHGPYRSSDYSLANAKKLAIFVDGTGNAVSDAIIRFVDEKPNYFKKVLVFNMGGGDALHYGISGAMMKGGVRTEVQEVQSTNDMLQGKLPEVMNSDVQLTILNFKNMNVDICEHVMKCVQHEHVVDGVKNEGCHIMICSAMWGQYLDIIRARDAKQLQQRKINAQKAENSGKPAEQPFLLRKIRNDLLHIETFEF
eukprot:g24778.t1